MAQLGNEPLLEGLGDKRIGLLGVDPDELDAAAKVSLDEFPR